MQLGANSEDAGTVEVKWPERRGRYHLAESGPDWAIYETQRSMGFLDQMTVGVSKVEWNGLRPASVEEAQNNGWGKLCGFHRHTPDPAAKLVDCDCRWLQLSGHVWRSVEEFLGSYAGMTWLPPRGRKPRPVEPMPQKELELWLKGATAAGLLPLAKGDQCPE